MTDIPKNYDFKATEGKINRLWEKSGFFSPDKLTKEKNKKNKNNYFSIVMPPPNVTGDLHMGHAEMLTLEDILIRYHRMLGEKTVWIPGTDHASIATQNKVEKILKKEGTSRHFLPKEEFLTRIKDFAKKSHDNIENQIRKMGSSCDWGREAYTLDKTRSKAVKMVFKMMYKDGLIYRGEKVVNWCPRCSSTLADDEVEYRDQKTKLYTFRYCKDFPFAISTTRPETKLGDTAVAVNPKDKRFLKYIGKRFTIDFLGQKLNLRIIGDRSVEMDFGTGALGVTPSHSKIDEKMARVHQLPFVKVIDEAGKIREGFGEFSGLKATEARKKITKKLKSAGLMEKEEEVTNSISLCYRCETPIEPLPSLQWFIDVNKKIPRFKKSIKDIAIEAVSKGVFNRSKIEFIPHRFEKEYLRWVTNLEDWCISRQIVFGHSIPVWYKNNKILCDITPPKEKGWRQDPDTLDTWFSSGLWTFTVMAKNPKDLQFKDGKIVVSGKDFKNFHPVSVLNTGYDIIFFWVARMILMTAYSISDIPFEKVFLHGLVKDEKGKKMSKSLGNVIDPLNVSEKYGTDAVRLSLLIGSSPGNDMKLNEEKIAGFRKFTNKLWNISRYILQRNSEVGNMNIDKNNFTSADSWILTKFKELVELTTKDLSGFNLARAGERLIDFTWSDFADWYLEASKFETNQTQKTALLHFILKNLLKLWHPFTPFITETIWQSFANNRLLLVEKWPKINDFPAYSGNKGDAFELLQEIVKSIRNLRSDHKISPDKKVDVTIEIIKDKWKGISTKEILKEGSNLIKKLRTGVQKVDITVPSKKKSPNSIHQSLGPINVIISLEGIVDTKKEKIKLKKELEKINNLISGAKKRLSDKNFTQKAPKEVVEKQKEILEKLEIEKREAEKQLNVH